MFVKSHSGCNEKSKQTIISQVRRKEMKNCKRGSYIVLKDLSKWRGGGEIVTYIEGIKQWPEDMNIFEW